MKRTPRPTRTLGRSRRLFGGYGPLLALAVAFLLVVTLVPTVARQEIVVAQGSAPDVAVAGTTATAPTPAPLAGSTGRASKAAPGAAASVPVAARKAPGVPGPAGAVAVAGPCADRRVQVVGDPYSPPCMAWLKGKDNGGATSSGVTKDSIKVSFRRPVEDISDLFAVFRQLAGDKAEKIPASTDADFRRTFTDLITYFNRNFQTYGRQVELVDWKGKGSLLQEIQGAGQEAATADAIKAAKELNAFADISAYSQPYNDALARQHVIAIGAPYLSQQWMAAHAPYSWSPWPDCTKVEAAVAEYLNKRVFGHPAEHAGPGVLDKPRRIGILTADNPEYQQCVHAAEKIINAAGNTVQLYSYTLDLSRFSDQANNLSAKMKQDGITTVVLLTDPLIPLLIGSRMSQQNYYPEWVVCGAVLIDYDEIGQLQDSAQWKHAFGISMTGQEQPQGAGYGYAAVKSVDPGHEPIFGVDYFYDIVYQLFTGIQMAGPGLTPQTFAAGMRAYPGGVGSQGTWGYTGADFTPERSAREIWWDPNATSLINGAPGRWISTNTWYLPGAWPTGPAAPQQLQILAREPATPPERQ